MIGVGLSIPELALRFRAPVALDAATSAAIAAMTVPPSAGRTWLYDALIKGLKADGLWAKLDWLSMFAAHDAQAALVNLKNPAQVASVVGAGLAYTIDRGYKGNGVDSYLSSGVLDTAAGNNTQDSAHLGVWVNVAATAIGGVVGTDGAGSHFLRLTPSGAAIIYRIHAASGGAGGTFATTGSLIGTRPDANNMLLYGNGSQTGLTAVASSVPTANAFTFLRGNSGMTDARVAAAFFGGGLSAGDAAAMHARLSAFITPIGAA